ncbi:hypothetical protein QYE76_022723 [Lolium multiflorum]|uniref:F-box domain-containing protein n=1 Tax=Lolium multiflorum TaxID=4521 RepID=A0AAD8RAB8_LOLMU|nr:hypothetical protein QYE76_022723 [Lolium multiflorum]
MPDCLLHDVLSHLGSRQVVQTSVLSRRWTHLWRDVVRANVVIDEREFAGNKRESFDDFADHVVPSSVPPETPHLDAFRLNLVRRGTCWPGSFADRDRWIRRALHRVPAAVDIRAAHAGTICWRPHRSDATGWCTRRLTTLRLVRAVLSPDFLEYVGTYCPALEDLHIESCQIKNHLVIASPTLRSLAFHDPIACDRFSITAPRLAHLRLAGFTARALLQEESQVFVVPDSLKSLILERCEVGAKFQALTAILPNTPNLEMLGLHHCTFVLYPRRNKEQQASKGPTPDVFWCQKLKSIQLKSGQEYQRHVVFDVLSKISKGMQLAQWLQKKVRLLVLTDTDNVYSRIRFQF